MFRGLVAVLVIVVLFVVLMAAVAASPGFGAWGAQAMRVVFGDRFAAAVESFSLSVADLFHRFTYALGIGHTKNPFGSGSAVADTAPSTATTPTTTTTTTTAAAAATSDKPTGEKPALPTTTTTTEASWPPADLTPMGTLQDEGTWSAYLFDRTGLSVGYRTALQPDKDRGYAVAAVVAVDLSHAGLHFVLGSAEPKSNANIDRPGTIPTAYKKPGTLLAAFNGGFQARHGEFGAMADGVLALPARPGMATIVMYKDGSVAIGTWGTDITPSDTMQSWRQNGPLVVATGKVNPQVTNSDPNLWGIVVGGGVATWRSGVGLSEDRRTLYYVVGPSLTVQSLAEAMRHAGVWQGFQLDINHDWTQFMSMTIKNGRLATVAVMDGMKAANKFLDRDWRDFFYLTGD